MKKERNWSLNIIVGIFFLLHGLVHLLYSGQSVRLFQLQPGMVWPDGSWAFTTLFGNETTRIIASGACVLAAVGFVAGGILLFTTQPWWQPVTIAAAIFSAAIFILLWDGHLQALANKGLFAILIDVAILVSLLVFRWPSFDF